MDKNVRIYFNDDKLLSSLDYRYRYKSKKCYVFAAPVFVEQKNLTLFRLKQLSSNEIGLFYNLFINEFNLEIIPTRAPDLNFS